ncbi:MAG: YciI family protein [Bacteroidota bacterium]
MRTVLFLSLLLTLLMSCDQPSTPVATNTETPSNSLAEASKDLPEVDTSLFETFRIKEGDQEYLMKKYYMVFLKSGDNRDQDSIEVARLQAAHMNHLNKMAEAKKICLAGPFGDDGAFRGIALYSTSTQAEADSLANADPAVQAGRLSVEVHPWWGAVGTELY